RLADAEDTTGFCHELGAVPLRAELEPNLPASESLRDFSLFQRVRKVRQRGNDLFAESVIHFFFDRCRVMLIPSGAHLVGPRSASRSSCCLSISRMTFFSLGAMLSFWLFG